MLGNVAYSDKNNQYMIVPSVSMKADFTISFWVSTTSTTNKFLTLTGENGQTFSLQLHYAKAVEKGLKAQLAGVNKTFNINDSLLQSHPEQWQHITIVKNGKYLSCGLMESTEICGHILMLLMK